MNVIDVIVNTNTILILLGVGTIIWVIRQVLPDRIENHKVWKVILRVLPICLGSGLAMIPTLSPMKEVVQNALVGGVAGSFSASAYEIARELFGERVKLLLGSKATRNTISPSNPNDEG